MKELHPRTTVERSVPVNLQEGDWNFFRREKKRIIPSSNLLTAKNVFVSDEGVAFTFFRTLKQGESSSEKVKKYNTYKYRLSYLVKRVRIPVKAKEKYILAFDSRYSGYFHWLADTIPRLISIKEECEGAVLILPHQVSQFHLDSLDIFKFKALHFLPFLTYSKIPFLLLPEMIAPSGNYNVSVMDKIRYSYTSFYNLEIRKPFRIVYISRAKSERRKIENESEFKWILEKLNVETHFFEDYSFEEQVKLARETKILISIHGAGLTNMLFMERNTKVLEVRKENDATNLCYFSLASALNIHYYYLWGNSLAIDEDTHTANLWIDTAKFEEVLISMLYGS